MRSAASDPNREAGSVLVEAMVAVAILAMVLAVTYRTLGDSLLRARAAEASRTAVLIAQSRLAAVGSEIPLQPGETSGVDGAFAWRVSIEPAPQDPSTTGQLLAVTASVRSQSQPQNQPSRRPADLAVLHSQRLAPPA